MTFGVCACISNENLYLREWVEHYLNLGFDKIILYDNNDIDGEIPSIVIQDYINSDKVVIHNRRGIYEMQSIQAEVYNECLTLHKEIDWILFVDLDEFLELKMHNKIQDVFDSFNYNDFNEIVINWFNISEVNELYYKNEPVQKRFKKHNNEYIYEDIIKDSYCKAFIKTASNAKFTHDNVHIAENDKICSVWCEQVFVPEHCFRVLPITHEIMYIKHYWCKSLVEFLYRKLIFYKKFKLDNTEIEQCIKEKYVQENNYWSEEHEKIYQKFLKDNNIKAS